MTGVFKAALLLSFLVLLDSSDCDPQKQSARIGTLENDVKELKHEVADLKEKQSTPTHHYELRNEGFRTFRFDSSTGETCIQLTTTADWKRKETKGQSCGCVDAVEHWSKMPAQTDAQIQEAQNYLNGLVKVK